MNMRVRLELTQVRVVRSRVEGGKRGIREERARIVAWLRGWEDGPGFGYADGMCDVLQTVADAIEKGEHVSGTKAG